MSDTVAVALITGGATALVGIAGLGFSFWNSSRERAQRLAEREEDYREWYSRTLFEKRLGAVQEAYAWWMRLNAAISRAGPGQRDLPENAELGSISAEARQWYDRNALYMYDTLPSQSSFVGLVNAAFRYAVSARGEERIGQALEEAYAEIRSRADQLLKTERERTTSDDDNSTAGP